MTFDFGDWDDAAFANHLVSEGHLSKATGDRAVSASTQAGSPIEQTLLELGLLSEDVLFGCLAAYLSLPFADAGSFDGSAPSTLGLDTTFLERAQAFPIDAGEHDAPIKVAIANPRAKATIDSLTFYLGREIEVTLAPPSVIKGALQQLAGTSEPNLETPEAAEQDIARLKALAHDGPVIKMVNDIITHAVEDRASDVHIEAEATGARVRLRIDGILKTHSQIPASQKAAVASRLKVMGNMNISERRRPQDGRANAMVRGRSIDIRVSTLPTQHGESVVLRLLDRNRVELSWAALGFFDDDVEQIEALITKPNGIFLVAGPTGSGKTTTLYTALNKINSEERKIVTVEDPIEYAIVGVNQTQVQPEIEMTFARALRAILRQDPDVVMIGEIRDEETAAIAVRAALVGRLVLSTIHTNDSVSTIDRLRDLNVPDYLIAATLRGVLSQRLVRRICAACAGAGCQDCNSSGSSGRIVVPELLKVTDNIANAIKDADSKSLLSAAKQEGTRTLSERADNMADLGLVQRLEALRALGT